MIKILYFIDNIASAGGIQEQAYNWIKYIDHTKFHIDIIGYKQLDEEGNPINNEQDYVNRVKEFGTEVFIISPMKRGYYLKNLAEIKDFFAKHHDYNIMHVHGSSKAYLFLKEAKKWNINTRIIHSHSTRFQTCNKLKIFMGNILKNRMKYYATDFFSCTEEAGKWLFGNGITKKRCHIIHNAIDTNKFVFNEDVRKKVRDSLELKNETVIINVGRFSQVKNHIYLVPILNQLKEKGINFKMIFVGDAVRGNTTWKDNVISELEKFNLLDNCLFLGVRNDINELLQAADFFVLPSTFEGLGIVCIEAQCSGLMCAVSNRVPREAKTSNLISFLKLESSENEWVKFVTNNIGYNRVSPINELKSHDYEITSNCRHLESLYFNCLNKNR